MLVTGGVQVMLLQLTPEQVSKLWGIVKPAILNALPPFSSEKNYIGNNILDSLLIGKLQCWVSYKDGDLKTSDGIITTMVVQDDITGGKNLLIFSAFSFTVVDLKQYLEGFTAIREYAKKLGCESLVWYTENEKLIEKMKNLGNVASYHYCKLKL